MSPTDPKDKYASKVWTLWGFGLISGLISLLVWFTVQAANAAASAVSSANTAISKTAELDKQNAVVVERLSAMQSTLNEVRSDVKRLNAHP